MVCAAWVKVAGSSPKVGILAQMCECARNAFTHSIAHSFPSEGLEHGSLGLQSGRLPNSQTSQSGHPRFPHITREIPEHVLEITGVVFLGPIRG